MNQAPQPLKPYKGLMPYSKEDALFFFGRGREQQLIVANLMASRLTLLYGPSGVGKSSVIHAGVVCELQKRGRENLAQRGTPEHVIVVHSAWRDDPIAALQKRVAEAVQQIIPDSKCEEPSPSQKLADSLQAWSKCANSELLIVLDQFEEYFLYHGKENGEGTFAVELPRAIGRPGLRVNFLISIREDALAKLDFFKGRIPNLFDNYLRIEHLSREEARKAIELPLDRYNDLQPQTSRVNIEQPLVEAVLDQVRIGQVLWSGSGRGTVELEGDGDQIETPYLQLVMTRLWDEETLAGSRSLRLQTLEKLGGAKSIVRTHLDNTMSALFPAEQDIAAQVFRYLVTPSGAKIALTVDDLLSYTELPQAQISSILTRLSSSDVRILRAMNPVAGTQTELRYEIFHDVLATSILDWQARHVHSRELASVRKNLFSLLLPFAIGTVGEMILCGLPVGAVLIWLVLSNKTPPLKKDLVKAVTAGWAAGWLLGWVAFFGIYIVILMAPASDALMYVIVLLAIGGRLLAPTGSAIAFYRWRRKARAKLALTKALAG